MPGSETTLVTTVTLNAAIDRTLVVPSFQTGRRHRASSGVTLPGGRGVTIARALKQLGIPAIASGLAGGHTGASIVERLTDEGILNDFLRIADASRTSTAVIDPIGGDQTEINEYGPRVTALEIEQFEKKLKYLARASRCVVIAGSLPRDVPDDTYQRLIRSLHTQGDILTVLTGPDDTPTLANALEAEPMLTVLDQREAEAVAGHEFAADEDFVMGLDAMGRMGARSVCIVTERGCYARIRQGREIQYWSAVVEGDSRFSQLSAVDVFVAGYLNMAFRDRDVPERLQHALAVVQANSLSLGGGIFETSDLAKAVKNVTVRSVPAVMPVAAE